MGRSSKFVITGDITQVDLPRNQNSGLVQAMKILKNIKGIDFITLDIRDVVRHKPVTRGHRDKEKWGNGDKGTKK